MSTSANQFSQLVSNAVAPSSSQQRRALQMITAIAGDPNTSSTDLAAIWEELEHYLPHRNINVYLGVDFLDFSQICAQNNRSKHLLRTRYKQIIPIVMVIAANPGIPIQVLTEIAYYAPKAFCANPALHHLLDKQPDWFQHLGGKALGEEGNATIMRLLRCDNAPHLLVEPLSHGELDNTLQSTLISRKGQNLISGEALRHIAIVGESDETAWIKEVDNFWSSYANVALAVEKQKYEEFAIAGLLPAWGAGETTAEQEAFQEARKRFHCAIDPEINPEVCANLARNDPSFAVRLAATINPVTPESERHRAAREGIAAMIPVLRRHSNRKSAKEIASACRDVIQDWRRMPYFGFVWEYRLLEVFVWVKSNPHFVENPAHSQEEGEYWVVLLAWALGVQPNAAGIWESHEKAGLEALANDGNRWVRAAAKARLYDPKAGFTW